MANTATPLALVPRTQSVERRLEAALDRIVELEECLGARTEFMSRLKLTECEQALLGMVLKREIMSYETLYTTLFSNRYDGGPEDPKKVIWVRMHDLRRKLRRIDPKIVILARYGVGYYMTEEAKERLRKMIS